MSALSHQVGTLEGELGSSRDPGSVRGRLHIVENDRTATRAAQAALESARHERLVAAELQEERATRRWSKRQMILVFVIALPTALPTIVGAWLTLLQNVLHG